MRTMAKEEKAWDDNNADGRSKENVAAKIPLLLLI